MARKRRIEEWDLIFSELTAAKEWERLLEKANQCIKEWPDEFVGYAARAAAKNKLGRYKEAITDLGKAIALEPNNEKAYNSRGYAKNRLGHYEEAITDYDKSIELKPDYEKAYNNRGYAKNRLGQYEKAITDYDKAIELKSDFATAYNNRGYAKNRLKRYEEAITDYDKAIELKPDYGRAYSNRGYAKNRLKRYAEAITDHEKAIELEPENYEFHRGHAIAIASSNAAETRETLLDEYKRQLEDVQNISAITENFTIHAEYLEYLLYGYPPLGRNAPLDGDTASGEPPSGDGSTSHNEKHPKQSYKKHIGWIKQAETASGRARWVLLVIASMSYMVFFIFSGILDLNSKSDISFLDILQLNAFILLLYFPFLIFNKHLSDRVDRTITLLHAIKRDRYRLSFYAAQAPNDIDTKKSRLAPAVLEHLQTNSAADIYLKMTHNRRAWRGTQIEKMPKDISLKIAARLDDIEKAIKKNLTLTRSE